MHVTEVDLPEQERSKETVQQGRSCKIRRRGTVEFGEKKRKIKAITASRSFKVIEVGTNRKPVCDFLLVINSN